MPSYDEIVCCFVLRYLWQFCDHHWHLIVCAGLKKIKGTCQAGDGWRPAVRHKALQRCKLALKGLLHKKKLFFDGRLASLSRVRTPWLPPKALPLTCYMHPGAHSIGPPGFRSLPTGALKTCQLVPWKSNWCPRNCRLFCCCELLPTDQAAISRAPVRFPGHQLAGFQGTSWQTSGPRGPNTMSTFVDVVGQGEGLGKQSRCFWTRQSTIN